MIKLPNVDNDWRAAAKQLFKTLDRRDDLIKRGQELANEKV